MEGKYAVKKSVVYAIWGVLYCICVGLGFVQEPAGFGKILLVLTSLIFFLPPAYLLWQARKEKSRKTVLVLRLLSGSVLLLSLLLIILNFMSVNWSAQAGLVMYVLLVMFTAPMVCGQYWALSLFLWACILMVSLKRLPGQTRPDRR